MVGLSGRYIGARLESACLGIERIAFHGLVVVHQVFVLRHPVEEALDFGGSKFDGSSRAKERQTFVFFFHSVWEVFGESAVKISFEFPEGVDACDVKGAKTGGLRLFAPAHDVLNGGQSGASPLVGLPGMRVKFGSVRWLGRFGVNPFSDSKPRAGPKLALLSAVPQHFVRGNLRSFFDSFFGRNPNRFFCGHESSLKQ